MPDVPSFSPEREIERTFGRVAERRARIVIPEPTGLRRHRPGSHFHSSPEFFFQAGGGSDFECPSGRFRLRTGEICIMPAGVPHAETPLDLRTPYRLVVLMRSSDGFIALRGKADAQRRIHSMDPVRFSGGGYAFQFLELAALACRMNRSLRGDYTHGVVTAFLSVILSEMKHPSRAERETRPTLVREAEKIVHVDISKADLSVEGIASRLAISPDHLTRLFQKARGMSLGAWISLERIQLARELLARPEHNISEVAWACGFASASYFIRVFRSHCGTTPREWRIREAEIRNSEFM